MKVWEKKFQIIPIHANSKQPKKKKKDGEKTTKEKRKFSKGKAHKEMWTLN